MKELKIQVRIDEYDSIDELSESDQLLLSASEKSLNSAYAPYSNFRVGAAVLLDNGMIIQGSNQENAAYPSGLCAERVALFYASSQYPGSLVRAIAISAKADHFEITEPVTPCGSCRQVIAEYEKKNHHPIRIIMKGEKGKILVTEGIINLLPLMFKEEKLKIQR